MNIIMKTCSGIHLVPLESQLLADRKIYIQGTIDENAACEFEQKIQYLLSVDKEKPINIYIDTPGGNILSGLHIYDIIKGLKPDTTLWCREFAASMGAIIFAGGQKGRRFIFPHAKVLLHEPLVLGGTDGSATSLRKTAETVLEYKALLAELLAADTGQEKNVIESVLSYDHIFDASQACKFGLADKIVTELQ